MYSRFKYASKYLAYLLRAMNGRGHGMHSPFVFDFITRVMNDRTDYPEYGRVESLRRQLLNNPDILEVEDLGAGSKSTSSHRRSIASIARHAAKPAKYGQLLFRIARHYQPPTIVELGTSLGITTAYLALANPHATLVTLEGAPAVAAIARRNFDAIGAGNVQLKPGHFDDTLAAVLNGLPSPDLCFIDGNHRRAPTERYFHELLAASNNDTIMVFDDIHWSRDMEQAWQSIREHPAVRCTIDLFFIGIVLLREEFKEKQHFQVRF